MGYFVLIKLVLKFSFFIILTNTSVSIGFRILYFNHKGTCMKGILKTFKLGAVFPAFKIRLCERDTVMQKSGEDLPL